MWDEFGVWSELVVLHFFLYFSVHNDDDGDDNGIVNNGKYIKEQIGDELKLSFGS